MILLVIGVLIGILSMGFLYLLVWDIDLSLMDAAQGLYSSARATDGGTHEHSHRQVGVYDDEDN